MNICPICLHQKMLVAHHIYPTGYGGDPNGQLLDLCNGCHTSIHATAENLYGKQDNSIPKLIKKLYYT